MKNFIKKINVIDIGVILIFILFIVGLCIRFSGTTNTASVNNTVDIEYTVVVENIRNYTAEALKKSNILTEQKTGAIIGEIISVQTENDFDEEKGTDGKLYKAQIPNRYRCTLVLKSPVQKMNDRYFATDTTEVSIGKSFKFSTKYAECTGTVLSVSETNTENTK